MALDVLKKCAIPYWREKRGISLNVLLRVPKPIILEEIFLKKGVNVLLVNDLVQAIVEWNILTKFEGSIKNCD